jgi:RNA polymerase sigma-70 factor (sigma-E family)
MEFDEYVATRGRQLVRLGYTLTGDHQHAEDLAQVALTKAYRHWRRIRRGDDPHVYVRRVLVNSFASLVRKRSSGETPKAEVDPGGAAPDPADALAEQDILWRALATLTPRERVVIVLRFYEDLDDTAIAEVLGIKTTTVRSTASRGLASLRAAQAGASEEKVQ